MPKAIVIGGGVTGLFSAYYLKEEGWEVTIVDKSTMNDNCSYGNAGMIVPSHFTPLSSVGLIKQSIRWMFDRESPLQINFPRSIKEVRWISLFLRNAVMGKAKNGRIPLRDFSIYSLLLYKSLPHSLQAGIRHDGILMLSATEKTAHEEQELAKFANSFGLEATLLSKSETEQLQGGISLNIAGSVLYKCDSHLDPRMLMQQLIAHLEGSGVKFLRKTEIKSIDYKGSQVESIRTANGVKLTADAYVMAAGAYSADLAGSLSSNIPVVAGKGYSFLTEKVQLRVPCLLAEARVAITPLGSTTRVGGTMELGRMRPCVNLRRIGGIVKSVNKYIPGVNLQLPDKSEVWYGFRPCSPDGLPYLGISRKAKNLVFATGHGMLGVSLGPATGKLVARLLNGGPLAINIDAFSPDRFS